MAQYYSMFFKRWQWINGESLDQQEAVWPEITVMQFGIENTGCLQMIKTTIEHVRSRRVMTL
jgi:hypothetical protein